MTDNERALATLTAASLRAYRTLWALNIVVVILGWINFGFYIGLVLLFILLVQGYFVLRITIDERLFDRLGSGALTLEALDEALESLYARKTGARSMAERCQAAQRLGRWTLILSVLQIVCLFLTISYRLLL
ncbi:hypothetical protein L0B52_02045 [Suttonella sp. R2A3]|uniref:hypothetical protein n=1 Tax=Suttonella sp. R2A3 TaxID=2908648 RepID=UPI001F377B3F|nr:hypothetical protein [Suttonella sp. R2A3]UJF24944.1 hypothetical protein L0B52_02045 [Suttonella sp. R2A3]